MKILIILSVHQCILSDKERKQLHCEHLNITLIEFCMFFDQDRWTRSPYWPWAMLSKTH